MKGEIEMELIVNEDIEEVFRLMDADFSCEDYVSCRKITSPTTPLS